MKDKKRMLLIEQLDAKLLYFKEVNNLVLPSAGWTKSVRTALNMSLRQLGKILKISPQSVGEMESREANGTITINTLRDLARGLNMQLVYGFVPNDGSIDAMITARAEEIAKEIVGRTNATMALEDQQNTNERIAKAIAQKTEEIKTEMPKYLWD